MKLGPHRLVLESRAVALIVALLGTLASPTSVSAAPPTVDPIPPQIVNGGYASTPGLTANTTRFEVEWTDPDVGQVHAVQVVWGDGSTDPFMPATSPHTVEHTYAAVGNYTVQVSVRDSLNETRTVNTTVVVADMSSGADTKLYGPSLLNSNRFGQAVHLGGGLAVVGEPNTGGLQGRVHVYMTPDSGARWQFAQTLAATPLATEGFGTAVDVDGSVMAIGARAGFRPDGVRTGAVYIFERLGDGMWTQVQALHPIGGDEFGDFGVSLALDGDRLAVGAPARALGGSRRGSVHLFERDAGGAWTEVDQLTPLLVNNANVGSAVDLKGTELVIGAPFWSGSSSNGVVYLYSWPAGGLPSAPMTFAGSPINGVNGQQVGASVALSGTGLIVVGGPSATAGASGAVYIVTNVAGLLTSIATFLAQTETWLGEAVAIDGDLIAAHSLGTSSRIVSLFRRTDGAWGRAGTLTPDAGSGLVLSNSSNRRVAIDGGLVLSGQDSDSDLGTARGAAFIFKSGDVTAPLVSDLQLIPGVAVPIDVVVEIQALASDVGRGDTNIAGAEYRFDGGAWTPMTADDGAFDSEEELVYAFAFTNGLGLGMHEVCVRAEDAAGHVSDPVCAELEVVTASTATDFRLFCTHTPLWPQPGETVAIYMAVAGTDDARFFPVDRTEIWFESQAQPADVNDYSGTSSNTFNSPPLPAGDFSYGCRAVLGADSVWSGWRTVAVGWSGDGPIPVTYTGPESERIDMVFVADGDTYLGPLDPEFLEHVADTVTESIYWDPFYTRFQHLFNFWISTSTGLADRESPSTETPCIVVKPYDWDDRYSFAEVGVILHQDSFRDCARHGMFTTQPGKYDTTRHEAGHRPFGLSDEYASSSSYYQNEPFPNVYKTLVACEDDAPNLGRDPSACRELDPEFVEGLFYISDPETNDLMKDKGMPQANDVRRIEWLFDQCAAGEC